MFDPEKNENIDISGDIVKEWYQEKGISAEEIEKKREEDFKKPERREDEEPSSVSSVSKIEERDEEVKEKEEEKKLVVKEKVKELLRVAEEKGLERSIKEAQKENDPFLLDVYHDVLAKDAAFKKFLKK